VRLDHVPSGECESSLSVGLWGQASTKVRCTGWARALAPLKGAVLQTLADMALNLLGAGSAGISLRESGADGLPAFRSAAL